MGDINRRAEVGFKQNYKVDAEIWLPTLSKLMSAIKNYYKLHYYHERVKRSHRLHASHDVIACGGIPSYHDVIVRAYRPLMLSNYNLQETIHIYYMIKQCLKHEDFCRENVVLKQESDVHFTRDY